MSSLRKDIERVINGNSAESGSDTPDFILAEYLTDCLAAYDRAVTAREKWYGRECGGLSGPPPVDDTPPTLAPFFAPFDADGVLCVQDGKLSADPDEDRDWTEYHIEHMHGDVWRIERSDAAELCSVVYQGRIPDRAFFVAIMSNQETPPPDDWANTVSCHHAH